MAPFHRLVLTLAAATLAAWAAVVAVRGHLQALVRAEVAAALAGVSEARVSALEGRLRALEQAEVREPAPAAEARALAPAAEAPEDAGFREVFRRTGSELIMDMWGLDGLLGKAACGSDFKELDEVQANWSTAALDTVFLVAAFGEVVLASHSPTHPLSEWSMAKSYAERLGRHLERRIAFVRRLFSTSPVLPDLALLDYAFGRAMEASFSPRMLSVVAWGTFRGINANFTLPGGECRNFSLQGGHLHAHLQDVRATPNVQSYLQGHFAQVIRERNSKGETFLMEMAQFPKVGDCLTSLYLMDWSDMSFSDVNSNGETAAMLALLHGHVHDALHIERLDEGRDTTRLFSWSPDAKWPPARSAVGAHFLVVAVCACLLCCRPSPRGGTGLATFAIKVLVLATMNCLVKYGRHLPGLLPYLRELQEVSWVGGLNGNWPLAVLPALAFLAYVCHDLLEALQPSRRGLLDGRQGVVRAVSSYEDPCVPVFYCMQTFTLSCVFVLFFVSNLTTPVTSTFVSRAFWAAALLVQVYIGTKSQWYSKDRGCARSFGALGRWFVRLDEQENPGLWRALLQQAELRTGKEAAPKLAKAEVLLRFAMSYVANGLFQMVTLYTLPHYLASSGQATDFVLNAFAVTFIYQLDDLASEREYELQGGVEEDGSSSSESEEAKA